MYSRVSDRDNEMGLLILADEERLPAPAITGEALSGGPIGISEFGGKVVVLNAFASWCTPCQQELPVLAAAGWYCYCRGYGLSILPRACPSPSSLMNKAGWLGEFLAK